MKQRYCIQTINDAFSALVYILAAGLEVSLFHTAALWCGSDPLTELSTYVSFLISFDQALVSL